MIKWTEQSHGHVLTITMDKDKLHHDIQSEINRWNQIKTQIAEAAENGGDPSEDEPYERGRIGGNTDEYMTIDECIAELERFQKVIDEFAEKTNNEVMAMYPRKKNGTFKRNTRPCIDSLSFGTFYQEAYGWETTQLRIRAETDTEAVVELDSTTVHW